jgi:Putative zinc-finger
MNDAAECERARTLLAEVAAGALTGQERAMVLGHVTGCVACGRELAALSRVADELLLLTPELPPPPGFEAVAVQRMLATTARPKARRRLSRRWRPVLRFAAIVVALLLAATGGVVATLWRTAPDRQLAEQYRGVLTVASGRYVAAATVSTESGQVAGHIIFYEGTPSWMMVALTDAPEPGDYTMTVVTDDGYRYTAGICRVVDRSATVGYGLPIAVARVAAIELTKPGVRLIAYPG